MNPLKHIKNAHTRYDHQLFTICQRLEPKVTCTKGCFACCAEPLYVLADEAKHAIKGISPEELPGVIERLRAWLERAKATKMLDVEIPHVFAYRQARLMCPLMKDGLCLVYANRPLGCRSHCAVGDPQLCQDDNARLTQNYVSALEYLEECRNSMIWGSKRSVIGDHLGVFLAKFLLGEDVPSKSRMATSK